MSALLLPAMAAMVLAADAPPAVEATASKPPVAIAALKVGGGFPQVMSRLSTTFNVSAEAGYITPLLEHQLAAVVELAYTQPPHSRTVQDPRVSSGSVTYNLVERTFGIYLGPKYFIFPLSRKLVPWASLGIRVQFVDSSFTGTAGNPLGAHDETGTHVAFGGHVGCGYRVGPGFIAAELELISSPIDHLVTGNANIGDLALRAGYVMTF